MSMSKKDFIALADLVREFQIYLDGWSWLEESANHGKMPMVNTERAKIELKSRLADFCKQQNPEFKRDRWIGYIAGTNGPSGGAVK